MSLGDYLNVVLGQIAPRYQPADMRLATLLGAAEALDAGVTTMFDWNNATLSPEHADAALDGFALELAGRARRAGGYTCEELAAAPDAVRRCGGYACEPLAAAHRPRCRGCG